MITRDWLNFKRNYQLAIWNEGYVHTAIWFLFRKVVSITITVRICHMAVVLKPFLSAVHFRLTILPSGET